LELHKHHAIRTYWAVGVQRHLDSALYGGEWLVSRPDRYTPKKGPGTHWIGGPQSRYGPCSEEKTRLPLSAIEPQSSNPQTVPLLTDLILCKICRKGNNLLKPILV